MCSRWQRECGTLWQHLILWEQLACQSQASSDLISEAAVPSLGHALLMTVQGDFMYLRNIKFYFVKTGPLLASLCFLQTAQIQSQSFVDFMTKCIQPNQHGLPQQQSGGPWAWQRVVGSWGPWPVPGPSWATVVSHPPPEDRRPLSSFYRSGPSPLWETGSGSASHEAYLLPSWVRTETGGGRYGESVKAQNREVVLKEGLALPLDSPSSGVPAWAGKAP